MPNDADMNAAADFIEAWEPGPEMTVVKLARAFAAYREAAERAAYKRGQEDMQWRPIETAPDDGDMIVTDGQNVTVAFRDSGMSSYRFFSAATQSDLRFWPTHWMPLPALPIKETPDD